jgi:hypothetical protein
MLDTLVWFFRLARVWLLILAVTVTLVFLSYLELRTSGTPFVAVFTIGLVILWVWQVVRANRLTATIANVPTL